MTTTPERRTPVPRAQEPGPGGSAAPEVLPQQHNGDRRAEPAAGRNGAGAERTGEGTGATRAPVSSGQAAGHDAPRALRDVPRWVRWTVLPLLVLVPLGYLLISADQSRDGGANNEQEAAARHITPGLPSALQQRIYQVPFPYGAAGAGYLETNSWDTSVLYAQFTTTAGGLDTFLAKIGTSRDALHPGHDVITAAQTGAVGWNFGKGGPWSGVALHEVGDKPDHEIAVDFTDAEAPTVYVVSTVNFQHGFGGG